jgi:hypothetical protein
MKVGDVVKYGPRCWQWGRIIDIDPGMKREVCVQRRNRMWKPREDIEIVIPAQDWDAGLRGDVTRGEPFT